MISLKRYLEGDLPPEPGAETAATAGLLAATLAAYGSALAAAGNYSLDACPGLGEGLKQQLDALRRGLTPAVRPEVVASTDRTVQEQMRSWGQETVRHYRQKAAEVKELLLAMARAGESVGARDRRCAAQMNDMTVRLGQIATLEDLTEIRASIQRSAAELRMSIDRMTAEGAAVLEELKNQVSAYQAKLEAAEELASRDALTGVRNRMCMEMMLESRIAADLPFCVAMVDLDNFKKVNDTHGHLAGDELLKQFAGELRSACRSTDVIGRWGGDEFVILLELRLAEAIPQVERVRKWVCGDYNLSGAASPLKLSLHASIGLAERQPGEALQSLMARADAAMYEQKRTVQSGAA